MEQLQKSEETAEAGELHQWNNWKLYNIDMTFKSFKTTLYWIFLLNWN